MRALSLAVLLAVLATPAAGQTVCGSRAEILAQLETKYNERPVAIGLTREGMIAEIIAAADGTTWTMVVSRPDGLACLISAGEGWRVLTPPEKGNGT